MVENILDNCSTERYDTKLTKYFCNKYLNLVSITK